MIFDMGKRLGAGAVVLAVAVLMGCEAKEQAAAADATAATNTTAEAKPATLGSMDEQYAWVGDLGDRNALPGKPLYIEHCAGWHVCQARRGQRVERVGGRTTNVVATVGRDKGLFH